MQNLKLAVFFALLGTALAVKDDTFVTYVNGTNVGTLGISSLDGVPVTAAPKGTGFVTLTDFGKNQTGWVLDISEQLPNAASIKLFYYNSSLAASPAFLLLLGTDFSDYSPFGAFSIADLNTALAKIGVAPLGGPTPLQPLITGRNLLAAWISSTGQASVGIISDDPDVGPPPPDFNDTSYTAVADNTLTTFGNTPAPNASATVDITDNGDGTFDFDVFTDLGANEYNNTLYYPSALKIVASGSGNVPIVVLELPLTGQNWVQAASEIGYQTGAFTQADLDKGLKKLAGATGVSLYLQFDVSDISTNYVNYGDFVWSVDAPSVPSPKPKKSPPTKKSPPPRRSAVSSSSRK